MLLVEERAKKAPPMNNLQISNESVHFKHCTRKSIDLSVSFHLNTTSYHTKYIDDGPLR